MRTFNEFEWFAELMASILNSGDAWKREYEKATGKPAEIKKEETVTD